MPERTGRLPIDRQRGDRRVRLRLDVRAQHVAIVHPVELVAGEDQHVLHARLLDVADVLADRVGRPLVPVHALFHGLLRGQQLHEAAVELVEAVGLANVPMQAHREELRQHVDAVQPAVDAVRKRDVDQPVLGRQRHGRLRAEFGQRIQPRASAAAEHQRHDVSRSQVHVSHLRRTVDQSESAVSLWPR